MGTRTGTWMRTKAGVGTGLPSHRHTFLLSSVSTRGSECTCSRSVQLMVCGVSTVMQDVARTGASAALQTFFGGFSGPPGGRGRFWAVACALDPAEKGMAQSKQ